MKSFIVKYFIILTLLVSCTNVKTVGRDSFPEKKIFQFSCGDLNGIDIRDKFLGQYIRYVNINFASKQNSKSYPNPFSPSQFPSYFIFLEKGDFLDISLITNDSIFTAVKTQISKQGYYKFITDLFVLKKFDSKEQRIELLKNAKYYSVMVLINEEKFLYKLD